MADFRPDDVLALDIETIPDLDLMPSDWPPDKFPKTAWHKIACISFAHARIVREDGRECFVIQECRSGGDETYDEEMLLRSFWSFFQELKPRVVTWNGRSFDMAVLRFRAMMYGITTESWSNSGDKWSGYGHRYSAAWHCDLMEQLSDYGGSTRLTLQDASTALGFPGKIGGSGGSVSAMMAAGNLSAVRAYCECDCLLTLGVYLHWAHATGLSSAAGTITGLNEMVSYLETNAKHRPHFGEFLAGWRPRHPRSAAIASKPRLVVKPVAPIQIGRFGKVAPPPPDARSSAFRIG